MLTDLRMCINTQTPLVQFIPPASPAEAPPVGTADLAELVEHKDYRFSPGGVTRMVFPFVRRLQSEGVLGESHWVSLNPSGPETIRVGKIMLHHISLEQERLAGYGKVKEVLWSAVHGTETETRSSSNVFWSDDFSEYAFYNRLSAELIRRLDREHDFDLFYIHDFQQLPMGHMLGTLKPKIFRWHIPFDQTMIPDQWQPLLATYFNSYDMVIVSSSKYLASLKSFGYTGRVKKLYPYVDPTEFSRPSKKEVAAVAKGLGIEKEDEVALIVARMDPMKGQDRAIRALAAIAPRHPGLKLLLVGNGSFSSSKQGVGLSKSSEWRAGLEELTRRLGMEGRVIFAGHLSQAQLDAVYERCRFTILPSVNEGFGLVVAESWIHGKAALVTERAGVSELIEDGKNGLLFDPDDLKGLEEGMERLLGDEPLSRKIGQRGRITARKCSLDAGVKAETEMIDQLVGR